MRGTVPADVLVIMGSVRAGRVCERIAQWVVQIGRESTPLSCEAVDLVDWPLPMTDEAGIPARGVYEHEHTRAWSAKIEATRAFVFVTPQYNWGYPAALKNALDHLYGEWGGKPAMIVSYGGHGGGKSATQLLQVLGALKMRGIATNPQLVLTQAMIDESVVDPPRDFTDHTAEVRQAFAELAATLGG